jgi:hypothetical protein
MTRRVLLTVALFALTLATPIVAGAQEVNLSRLDDESVNRIYVRTGVEHAFVAGLGYARVVPVLGRRVLIYGDLTLPWAGLDFSDYRVRVGALVPIVGTGGFQLAGTFAPTLRGLEDTAARMTNLGLDLGVVGGYYSRHWFVAAELGFDWAITTYIRHSDEYRTQGYADARDGWYAPAGGIFRYGLQAGATFGRYDLVLRVGQPRDVRGNAMMMPLYATLTLDLKW